MKWQLSPDEKTLTRTDHSIPTSTKDISSTYERSGGPESGEDAFAGFWKRDWQKSDAIIISYSSKGDVFTFTSALGNVDERHCDGKDHPNTIVAGTLYSCDFPDERTYEMVVKRNGKVILTRTTKISEDGHSMVRAEKGADGKLASEQTYEKVE